MVDTEIGVSQYSIHVVLFDAMWQLFVSFVAHIGTVHLLSLIDTCLLEMVLVVLAGTYRGNLYTMVVNLLENCRMGAFVLCQSTKRQTHRHRVAAAVFRECHNAVDCREVAI